MQSVRMKRAVLVMGLPLVCLAGVAALIVHLVFCPGTQAGTGQTPPPVPASPWRSERTGDVLKHFTNADIQLLYSTVTNVLLSSGIRQQDILDIAIVGSWAQGCARFSPRGISDLDVAVFLGGDWEFDPQRHFHATNNALDAARYRVSVSTDFAEECGRAVDRLLVAASRRMPCVEVLFEPPSWYQTNNPACIMYSLGEREMYGRIMNFPRYVKVFWSAADGEFICMDRDACEVMETFMKSTPNGRAVLGVARDNTATLVELFEDESRIPDHYRGDTNKPGYRMFYFGPN